MLGSVKSTLPVSAAERHIRAWLDEFVVGLNLCPFARPLLGASNLRVVICEDSAPEALCRAFLQELDVLQGSTEREVATTLLAEVGGNGEVRAGQGLCGTEGTVGGDFG